MRVLLMFVFIFFTIELSAQIESGMLFGNWHCYHMEREDGNTGKDITFNRKPYSRNDLVLKFNKDFTGWESEGGVDFRYSLSDSVLHIGSRTYIIENISKEELILLEFKDDPLSLWNFRYKFKREDDL